MKIFSESRFKAKDIAEVVSLLKNDSLIVMPTDTIYGLVANARSRQAIEKIYQIKQRDLSKPVAIFLPNSEVAERIFNLNLSMQKILHHFTPGPLTIVAPIKESFKEKLPINFLNRSGADIGFRIVKHWAWQSLFDFDSELILAVTSANLSNEPNITNINQISSHFSGGDAINLIAGVVNGGELNSKASTVIRSAGENIEILREGLISSEQIFDIIR